MNKNNENMKGFDDMKSNRRGKAVSVVLVLMMVLGIVVMNQSVAFAYEVKVEDMQKYILDASDFTDESRRENTEDAIKENINLVDIMEQTKENGFSIITMSKVEEKNNRLYLLESASFTTIEFNEEININNGTEDLKLRSLVLNVVEDEIVPIYNSKVNYIQALMNKAFKEGYSPLKLAEKYNLQHDTSSVLFGDNSPSESVLKRDVSDLIFTDYMDGVDVETLKQEYGINDDYIRFVIEPKVIYNYFTVTMK